MSDSQAIPPNLQETIEKLSPHFIKLPADAEPPRIRVYANCCEHEIRRRGNEWRCVEDCRCMMMGCVPKVWDDVC